MNEELIQNVGPGYTPYAVLEGADTLVRLSDNRDIVTDTREDALPVVPKGGSTPIPFMPRGASNNLPYDVMNRIGVNVTVGSNVEFKNKVIYGDSLMVYRRYRDESGKIRKEEVLPEEAPEVFEFLELNDYDHIRRELANDLTIFYDAYVEYIFDRNDSPRIVRPRPSSKASPRPCAAGCSRHSRRWPPPETPRSRPSRPMNSTRCPPKRCACCRSIRPGSPPNDASCWPATTANASGGSSRTATSPCRAT